MGTFLRGPGCTVAPCLVSPDPDFETLGERVIPLKHNFPQISPNLLSFTPGCRHELSRGARLLWAVSRFPVLGGCDHEHPRLWSIERHHLARCLGLPGFQKKGPTHCLVSGQL